MAKNDQDRVADRIVELAQRIEKEIDGAGKASGDDSFQSKEMKQVPDSELNELRRFKGAAEYLRDIRLEITNQSRIESANGATESTLQENTDVSRQDDPFGQQDFPDRFGRFEIKGVLGQGGFARVFLANDPQLDRLVALKIPRPSTLSSTDSQIRFEREARATALLCHPNIVPVFESGTIGPARYIASSFCDGPTLANWFSQHKKTVEPRLAAAIVAQLAEAVEHAHQRGVIHRDLKPGNILLESNGESNELSNLVQSLRIADFGLAKVQQFDDQNLTVDGAVIGTPAYMSPEQADGTRPVDGLSDVYSLGVILYELLTGQLPFERPSHLSILKAIENDIPVSPRKIKASVPPDLDAICMKVLSKSSKNRYASAHDLASDLRCWMDGMPVTARKIGTAQRMVRWAQRNPLIATAITFAALSLSVGLSLTYWQWQIAQHNLSLSNAEFERAEENLASARLAIQQEKKQRLRAEKVAQFIGSTYRSPTPSNDGREVKVIDVLLRSEQEIESLFADDPETKWALLQQIGIAYNGLGLIDDALRVLQATRDQQVASNAPTTPDSVSLLINLADAYNGKGNYDLALESAQLAEQFANEHLGDSHERTIDSILSQAKILQNRGKYEAAIQLLNSAIDRVDQLDDYPPDAYWRMQGQLGCALSANRQIDQAFPILTESVSKLESIAGTDHPSTSILKTELVNVMVKMNRLDGVVQLREQIVESNQRVQGPEHPSTLMSLNNLASAYSMAGQLNEAAATYEDCVRKSQITFGPTSPNTSVPQQNLANILVKLDDPERAQDLYREVYEVYISTIGANHWRSRKCLHSLADVSEQLNDWVCAADSWLKLAASHDPDNPKESAAVKSCNARGGICQIRIGQFATGIEKVDEYFQFAPKSNMSEKQKQGTVTRLLARAIAALVSEKQYELANPYAKRFAERAIQSDAKPQPYDELMSLVFLATVEAGLEHDKAAAVLLEKVFEFDSELLNDIDRDEERTWIRESLEVLQDIMATNESSLAVFENQVREFITARLGRK